MLEAPDSTAGLAPGVGFLIDKKMFGHSQKIFQNDKNFVFVWSMGSI